jgi:hypothetical protein
VADIKGETMIKINVTDLLDLLAAIDALHKPYYDTCPDSFTMGERFCICGSDDPWPCPTVRLLHPEEARRG